MAKATNHMLLFSNSGFIKRLVIFLLITFSSTLLNDSLSLYYQVYDISPNELCDLPLCDSEPYCDSEAHEELKEKFEKFTSLKKSDILFVMEEHKEFFYMQDSFFNEKISDLPTPPPQLFV